MTGISANVVHSQDVRNCNRLLLKLQYEKIKRIDRDMETLRKATVMPVEPQDLIDRCELLLKLAVERKYEVEKTHFFKQVIETQA